MVFFLIFCFFFGIYYCASGRNGTEWNGNYYFLSFSAFTDLFWLDRKPYRYFFNFLNIFTIFLEFSITRCVGTERTDNFYLFSFSALSNLFWLARKPKWYILIFSILLLFFWNFQFRVG